VNLRESANILKNGRFISIAQIGVSNAAQL